jgi:hypothetical protein
LQKAFLDVRNELNDTKNQLDNTKNQLNNTRNGLNGTRHELERMINQRLEGIEGAFMRTFEVGGSINYYYPVAFQLPHDNVIGYKAGTPLMYGIHRY